MPLQAVLDLGRHVVLVVLGEHFLGDEHAPVVELAARDDALPFAEQVGQHAGVAHAHGVREVGEREADLEAAGLALDAAVLHQATDADAARIGRLARVDLRGAVVVKHVLVERLQRERGGDADTREDGGHGDHALLSRCHRVYS